MEIEHSTSLTLAAAEGIAKTALAAAAEAGVTICVAVLDRAGHPLLFKRQPGAPLHSIDIALDKAYTAVSFRRATGQWSERLASGSEMLRHGLLRRERFAGFGGGLPVTVDGQCVGAIGISGGSVAQDVVFCEAALAGMAQ